MRRTSERAPALTRRDPPPSPTRLAPGRVLDPQTLNRAQKHPDFFKAIREISESPTSATLQKWSDHEAIGPLVNEMFKAMMDKQFKSM